MLKNQFYKVKIDPKTVNITSIYDKVNRKEILNTTMYMGNGLIALENLGVDEAEELLTTGGGWETSLPS